MHLIPQNLLATVKHTVNAGAEKLTEALFGEASQENVRTGLSRLGYETLLLNQIARRKISSRQILSNQDSTTYCRQIHGRRHTGRLKRRA